VFCVNSLHHFASKPLFASEVRRVLRQQGGFTTIGLDPHTGLDKWWIYDYFENTLDLDKQRYLPANAISELLSALGSLMVAPKSCNVFMSLLQQGKFWTAAARRKQRPRSWLS